MVTRGKAILGASEAQIAYLAGIIDGEGCIGLHLAKNNPQRRINPRFQVELTVTNSNWDLIQWLHQTFGGKVHTRKKQKDYHKQTWYWKAQDHTGHAVCKMVLPYLICKRQQAEAVVKYYDEAPPRPMGRGAQTPPEEVERRMGLYLICRSLNDSRHPQRLNEKAPIPIWEKGEATV